MERINSNIARYRSLMALPTNPSLRDLRDKAVLSDIAMDDFIRKNSEGYRQYNRFNIMQSNAGRLWQRVIGDYNDNQDLSTGHPSGLDILNTREKFVMELKNRYNTDNSSSKKQNFFKLSEFKRQNPDYRCIYGVMNEKNRGAKCYSFLHNGQELVYMSGEILLRHLFGSDRDLVVGIVQSICSDL